jgi:hypothetical protein
MKSPNSWDENKNEWESFFSVEKHFRNEPERTRKK